MTTRAHTAETVDCQQADKIDGIERELGSLNTAVFRGNGKPSLISQMAVVDAKINGLCWVAGITLGAVIGQMVILFFRMIGKV
jgi:hypothetical protein